MDPQDIRTLFEKLREASTEPETVARLCEKYLSETTPTYELSIMGATVDPYNLIHSLKDKASGLPVIKRMAEGLTALLHEKGYRNNIETHQEQVLFGSSDSGLNPNANEFPYTVGAILNGEITIEEARRARKLEHLKRNIIGVHWGIDGLHCILLPEIDDNGLSVRDPILVDSRGNVLAEKLVKGAPYKR